MRNRVYYVYFLVNKTNTVLYIGVTGDLIRRVLAHKAGKASKFTTKYNVNKLVYFEAFGDVYLALEREKQLKGWRRLKKDMLVDRSNKPWRDLYFTLF